MSEIHIKKKIPRSSVTVRLDTEDKNRLETIASEHGVSLNSLICQLVHHALEDLDKL